MKAISIKEPWASMILAGKKTIETRKWATKYRGKILLCASKSPKSDISGMAFAIADIVNVRSMTRGDEKKACCEIYEGAFSWELGNVKKIKPFGVKGQLGLFNVDYRGDMGMSKYIIEINGMEMGEYVGKTEDEALDAYAKDAGYKNYADLLKRVPGSKRDEVNITKVGLLVKKESMKQYIVKKDLEYLSNVAGSDTTSTKKVIEELNKLPEAKKRELKKDFDEFNDYILMEYPEFYEAIVEPLKYGVQQGDYDFLKSLMKRF